MNFVVCELYFKKCLKENIIKLSFWVFGNIGRIITIQKHVKFVKKKKLLQKKKHWGQKDF